jgi:hypothetical protein
MIAILGIIYCLGAYLVFIKFRLLKFNLFWQVVVGVVGFFGLLTILYGMNYTQPFSTGSTVSGLTTQIEARVPGKVTIRRPHTRPMMATSRRSLFSRGQWSP